MKYLLALLTAFVLVPTLRPVDTFAQISLGDCDCDECGGSGCVAAGNCCVSGGGLYFDIRAGAMYQQRGTFQLGKITEDSNDLDAG